MRTFNIQMDEEAIKLIIMGLSELPLKVSIKMVTDLQNILDTKDSIATLQKENNESTNDDAVQNQ